MFSIEWEFLPAPGRADEFVVAYGADGPWVTDIACARLTAEERHVRG